MKILVVEDVADFANLVTAFLRRLGHSVQWAGDGTKAFRHLKRDAYDIAIIDLRLPESNHQAFSGVELIRRIHEKKCKGSPAVIVLTAFPDDLPVPEPEHYGVVSYVVVKSPKSFDKTRLKKALKYCKDLIEERRDRERGAEICDRTIADRKITPKEGMVAVVNIDKEECQLFDNEADAFGYAKEKGGKRPYVRYFDSKLCNSLRRVRG